MQDVANFAFTLEEIYNDFGRRVELSREWMPCKSTNRRSSRLNNSTDDAAPSSQACIEQSLDETSLLSQDSSDTSSLTEQSAIPSSSYCSMPQVRVEDPGLESSVSTCEPKSIDAGKVQDIETEEAKSEGAIDTASFNVANCFDDAVVDYLVHLSNETGKQLGLKPGTAADICTAESLISTAEVVASASQVSNHSSVNQIDSDMSSCKADSDVYVSTETKKSPLRSDSDMSSCNVDLDMCVDNPNESLNAARIKVQPDKVNTHNVTTITTQLAAEAISAQQSSDRG